MTVVVQTPFNQHTANGVTTLFGFTFQLLAEGDLQVSLDEVVQGSGYTISGLGVQAGGSITFSVAPANGVIVDIRRAIPLARSTDYQQNGDLPSDQIDEDYDRLWQALQDADFNAGLTVQVPLGDAAAPVTIPAVADRAGKFLAFDGSGNAIAADALAAGVVVSTFMETVLDDANAADARTTLGAAGSGSVGSSGLTMGTARILGRDTAGTGAVEELTAAEVKTLAGLVIGTDVLAPDGNGASLTGMGRRVGQIVSSLSGAANSTANTIPWDDTIPQSSEGLEFFSLAITPANASSLLEIHVEFQGTSSSVAQIIVALFKDSETDARAAVDGNVGSGAGQPNKLAFTYHMVAGSTSAMTFKVRAGASAGSLTINGTGGARKLGGVLVSGITIKEFLPA